MRNFYVPEKIGRNGLYGAPDPIFWHFWPFWDPEKTQVPGPQKDQKRKKSKFRQNEAGSSKIFSEDPMTNVLRLTREQFFFRFWIDGLEIWPG